MKAATSSSKLLVAVLALGFAVLLAAGLPGGETEPAGAQVVPPAKPNIIVLLTDDQESRSMRVMKITAKKLKRNGVTMKRFYDNFPLCCPSRATLLTGQYAHNHHVLSNTAPDGGYGVFNELHGENYLPLWLQDAGYRTSYVGKYLNEYAEPDEYGTVPSDVPLGWDDWHVLAPSRAQYFNYTLNQNGACASTRRRPRTTAPRSSPRRRATSYAPTRAPRLRSSSSSATRPRTAAVAATQDARATALQCQRLRTSAR